jgi:hypothetical protein
MNPFFESREAPDKTAIIVGERTMSYRALDLASRAKRLLLRGCPTPRRQGPNVEFASTPSLRDRSRRRCCPASVKALV